MHYAMATPGGSVTWGKWVFREIAAPARLVFVASFSDEARGITRHPLSAGWPLETLSTITFEERGGRTTVTVRASAHNATELERETFNGSHNALTQGWAGTFDQLGENLQAKLP